MERFWNADGAAVLVTCEYANTLGIVNWSVERIFNWLVHRQIPRMRNVVIDDYATPLTMLADYLEFIDNNILVSTEPAGFDNLPNCLREPRGPLLAHYDVDTQKMHILRKGYKDYVDRCGGNFFRHMEELSGPDNAPGVFKIPIQGW